MGHRLAAGDQPEVGQVVAADDGDVQRAAVDDQRQRIQAAQPCTLPVHVAPRTGNVGDDHVHERAVRVDVQEAVQRTGHQHGGRVGGQLPRREQVDALLVVLHALLDGDEALGRIVDVGRKVGEREGDLVAGLRAGTPAHGHRYAGDQRCLRQTIDFREVATQCAAAHGQHHVVAGGLEGTRNGADARHRIGLCGKAARSGDRLVEQAAVRLSTDDQVRFSALVVIDAAAQFVEHRAHRLQSFACQGTQARDAFGCRCRDGQRLRGGGLDRLDFPERWQVE